MHKLTSANGLRFAYLEAGPATGPLALLLHGFPDTAHGWAHLMPALADAGYHVVAPFTRGYAPTEAPDRPATLDDLAADAGALIEAVGHDKAEVLIGHDWGGATAYLVASIAPEKVGRLVAVGIPHPATITWTLRRLWLGRHFVGLNLPGAIGRMKKNNFAMVDTYYRRWSPTWNHGPEETAPVKASFADEGSLQAAVAYYYSIRNSRRLDGFKGRRIEVPTVAVAGQDDPGFAVADFEAARRRFTGSYRVEAFPGGHFVHRESPEAFRDMVLAFVKEALESAA